MHMLDNFVSPIVSHWDSYEELHFMQVGAPTNFALPLLAWFDRHFCGRWDWASTTIRMTSVGFLFQN